MPAIGTERLSSTERLIDGGSPTPKHSQLRQILLELIENELGIDQLLPSEREIAERFGVARMTVRQAVNHLVAEGRAYRVPGKGTFTARPRLVMPLTLTSFSRDMQERGMHPGAVEIGRRLEEAGPLLADRLRLPVGAPVHVIERVRLADGEPIAVERSHLVARRTPGLIDEPLDGRSLYALLEERYGLVIDSGEQSIAAGLADDEDAGLLRVARGSEVLRFERTSIAAGTPLEHAVSTYRGDRYQLHVSFSATPMQPTPMQPTPMESPRSTR